jgi:beta-glucanase (GH16 family)
MTISAALATLTVIIWLIPSALAASIGELTASALAASAEGNMHMNMTDAGPQGKIYGDVAAIDRDLAYSKFIHLRDNIYIGMQLSNPHPIGVLPVTVSTLSTIGTQTIGRGANTLALLLGEDQYAGDVEFTISINNQKIGDVYTVQALQSQGQDQQFLFKGNWGANAAVTVTFINAASNGQVGNGNTRKLYIDKASYGGNALVLPATSLTGEFANTSSVTLDMNATTSLAAASDMTVAPGGLGTILNLSGYHLTYDDEFNAMPTMSPVAGQAQYDTTLAGFPYPNVQGMRILANGDQQYYTDRTTGGDPFSIVNGALVISATYVGAGNTPAGGGATGPSYTSGQITTEGSFGQQYGYFEMRAKLPQGAGMWPAFWMLDNNSYLGGGWDPELDIMEAFGSKAADGEGGPTQSHWAIHTPSHSPGGWATLPNGGNAYNGYHTYGVLWTPQIIAFYIDGIQIGQTATPSDFTEQMYMIVNLAVGGSWPGNAAGENAKMSIDYLRAYSSNIAIPAVELQKISAPDGDANTHLYGAIALNTPPVLAITSLALAHDTGTSAIDYVTDKGSVTFSGTVQHASRVSIEIYDNGADLGKATVTGANWTFATTLRVGSHKLSAKASGPYGNVGSVTATQTITVVPVPQRLPSRQSPPGHSG